MAWRLVLVWSTGQARQAIKRPYYTLVICMFFKSQLYLYLYLYLLYSFVICSIWDDDDCAVRSIVNRDCIALSDVKKCATNATIKQRMLDEEQLPLFICSFRINRS